MFPSSIILFCMSSHRIIMIESESTHIHPLYPDNHPDHKLHTYLLPSLSLSLSLYLSSLLLTLLLLLKVSARTMGRQGKAATPATMEAVEEIMMIYRSLPPKPSPEEVEAAMAVIKTADSEEEKKLQEIGRFQKPSDLMDELFSVLQDARKNLVYLQAQQQRREALQVVELDKSLQVFDELIQRASKLVSSEEDVREGLQDEKGKNFEDGVAPRMVLRSPSLITKVKDENKPDMKVSRYLVHESLPKVEAFSGGDDAEKLSLIQVASLIEIKSKDATGVLDLQGKLKDQIEWLPTSLGKLQDITELNLSENRIMALPSSISSLKFLRKLDAHSDQLVNLPDSFGELSNLTDLDLHANRLISLPSSFGNLTSLVNLDLSSNQLRVLPETLGNLTSLRILNVETNELEELPFTIGACTTLVELRLDFNQLKALPEAIGKLEYLEVLTLHYNRIKGLPTTMSSLSKLMELDVSFNELESIPESLCFATSLVKLNVGRNFADLTSLPRSIGNLENLEELDISSNQIRVLPDSFRSLSKLRVFHADETPLELPPREIAKLGAQAVVPYMADLVAARNSGPRETERKGYCLWLCSFSGNRKNLNSRTAMASPKD